MPTPKKGPRFGRDPAHQRLMMANLAASLFAAEAIVTTEAKAKVLRPYAEKLITKAKKGGVHERRQVIATIHDQDVTHKLFADIAPRYAEPSGWVPADPEAGSPPRRQRAHGAHRAGVTLFEAGHAGLGTRRTRSRSSSRTTARTSTASRRNRGSAPSRACSLEALEQMLRGDVEDFACAGRTDAGVHAWGQVVSLSTAADVEPDRLAHALRTRLGPGGRGARRPGRSTSDFDARHSARGATYRYTVVNRPAPDPFLARYAWWVPEPLELARLRLGADPFVGEHDFAAFCRKGPEGSTDRSGGCCGRTGTSIDDGVLRYEIRATRVLLADGALDRRHPRRDRPGPPHARRRHGHPALRRPGPRRPASPRRRASCLWAVDYPERSRDLRPIGAGRRTHDCWETGGATSIAGLPGA